MKRDKDFGPTWLNGIQGSLAEERRLGSPSKIKDYNRKVRRARRLLNREDPKKDEKRLTLHDYFTDPNLFNIKLSQLWTRYPELEIDFSFSIRKLTGGNTKLIRGFVIWFYLNQDWINPYVKYEIEEQLDSLLYKEKFPKNDKILREIIVIRKCFLVTGDLGLHILYSVYRDSNIDKWIETTNILINRYNPVRIPMAKVKPKVQRRGYRESHCNKRISKDRRGEVKMSNENRSMEEIKQSILRKQALLFERRLDQFLALEDANIPLSKRKEIFMSLTDPVEIQEEIITDQDIKE